MALLRALSKIGLVELDEKSTATPAAGGADVDATDVEALLADLATSSTPTNDAPVPVATLGGDTTPVSGGHWAEGVDVADIYKAAGVPDSPYPVERFATLVGGLKALGPVAATAAIKAMDEADPGWSITDVAADKAAKEAALDSVIASLNDQVVLAEQARNRAVLEADRQLEEATRLIKEQIAELEGQLATFAAEAASEKTAAENNLSAVRESTAREAARLGTVKQNLAALAPYIKVPSTPTV